MEGGGDVKAGDYIDQALAAAQAATPDRRDGDLRVLRVHDWTAIAGSPIASVDTMHNYMRTDVVSFALHYLAQLLVSFAPSIGGDTIDTSRVILVRRREPVGKWRIHSYGHADYDTADECVAALNAGTRFCEFKAVNLGDVEAAARAEQERWRAKDRHLRQTLVDLAQDFASDPSHAAGLTHAIACLDDATRGFSR